MTGFQSPNDVIPLLVRGSEMLHPIWEEARTGNVEQLFGTPEQDSSSSCC
jgi:hypothetical protein